MIYVVRHGETDWNKKNRVLGRTDIPLNETGYSQAAALAEKLKDYKIEMILASPLNRAMETARVISEKINVPYRAENLLIEQNFGIYEGVDRSDATYQVAKREYFNRYPEGESYFDVVARIYPFIKNMDENKNVLLVTHGGICRVICSYYNDMSNEEFPAFVQGNCEIRGYRD